MPTSTTQRFDVPSIGLALLPFLASGEEGKHLEFAADMLIVVANKRESAMEYMQVVAERAIRARSLLDGNMHVNSSGELQSAALHADAACAEYELAINSYKRARHFLICSGVVSASNVEKFERNAGWSA